MLMFPAMFQKYTLSNHIFRENNIRLFEKLSIGRLQIHRHFSVRAQLAMPVKLYGSCHCGKVRFHVDSHTPVPYQLCACSICRKVGGYGGSVNLGAIFQTLRVTQGEEYIKSYNAVMNRDTKDERKASSERKFCGECSSMLWLWDKHWPELCHPFASAIDSPEMKNPKTMVCVKGDSKPPWVRWPEGDKVICEGYNGDVSIEEWHKQNGEWVK